METQVVIVGFGIAGANLAYTLYKRDIDFIVIDEPRDVTSSKVAAGLYNPVTGRRAVKTWLADELFPFAKNFYRTVEKDLSIEILNDRNGYRLYNEHKDMGRLQRKSEKPEFQGYMNTAFTGDAFAEKVVNNLGGVEILQSGNLSITTYLAAFKEKLISENRFLETTCTPDDLDYSERGVSFNGITAEKIVFAEGFRALENPLFSWLPFDVTKGEILRISCDFPQTHILNRGFFLLPVGNGEFLAGSSYDHVADESITEKGRAYLISKLKTLLLPPFEIVDHRAAVRPTVSDHKPLLGQHPECGRVFIFNGMGTKGVTLSPYFAEQFAAYLFENGELSHEVNIARFHELYRQSIQ